MRIIRLILQKIEKIRRTIVAIGLFLLIIAPISVFCEQTVLLLNDANDSPYTTPRQDGFINLIATEIFNRAGLGLKLVKLPAERGLLNANEGIIDGELSRIEGLDRKYKNLLRVPEILLEWEFAAFSKSSVNLSDANKLNQYSLGLIKGWKIYETMFAKANLTQVETPEQLFELLEKDRIQIALYENWMGKRLIQNLGIKDVHVILPIIKRKGMFIYLNKKHSAVIPKLLKELRKLKKDGFYKKIYLDKINSFLVN